MLSSFKTLVSVAVLFLSLFILSGCSAEEIKQETWNKLEWLNQKAGEQVGGSDTPKDPASSRGEEEGKLRAEDLTEKQKKKIDKWLEEQGLNRYGDSQGVIYPNGTPLYNKDKDKKIKRFNYILNRYPDILERIKKD